MPRTGPTGNRAVFEQRGVLGRIAVDQGFVRRDLDTASDHHFQADGREHQAPEVDRLPARDLESADQFTRAGAEIDPTIARGVGEMRKFVFAFGQHADEQGGIARQARRDLVERMLLAGFLRAGRRDLLDDQVVEAPDQRGVGRDADDDRGGIGTRSVLDRIGRARHGIAGAEQQRGDERERRTKPARKTGREHGIGFRVRAGGMCASALQTIACPSAPPL